MKLTSAAFVLLLLGAHGVGDSEQRLGLPLSVFRDGEWGWLGYLLFAALLLVCLLYTAALVRAGKEEEAITAGLAALLLFLVALTSSLGVFHLLCSLLLLLLLFAYYWRLLRESGSPWLIAHALAPFLLILASGCHSYGLWQKSLIVYLVVLGNIRLHLLGRAASARLLPAVGLQRADGGGGSRRKKVYRLEPGRAWTASRIRPSSGPRRGRGRS